VSAKIAQILADHHSARFTLDQYADAVPEQLEEADEKVAAVLRAASGSRAAADCAVEPDLLVNAVSRTCGEYRLGN
jgi:hypothetical protein